MSCDEEHHRKVGKRMAHVNSPSHYTRGNIEVWDFIRDQDLNYHLGNAIKYICRAGFKGDNSKTQDLEKAINYLENELQHLRSLQKPITFGPSDSVPYGLWDDEWDWESDDATGSDLGGVQGAHGSSSE